MLEACDTIKEELEDRLQFFRDANKPLEEERLRERTLHDVELNSKNMIIFAVMGTIGISGIALTFGAFTLSTIALSMIIGLALNLILK